MKSFKNIKSFSILVLVSIMVHGCTKNFKELNTDPKLVLEELAPPEFLLTDVQVKAGAGLRASDAGNYAGMTVRQDNVPFDDRFDDDAWYSTYALDHNLAAIIRKTIGNPDLVNKKAIARIMRVWIYSQATDIYGDIPYFEANKAPTEAITSPKYDPQKSIYQDFFKELKEAAGELNAGKESFGNADLYYGGDVSKWKKFANSLRLRLALRVRYVDAQMAKDNMSDLQESDLITSRADDASIYTLNDIEAHRNSAYNGLVNFNGNPQDYVDLQFVGKALLDAMVANSDPTKPLDPRLKVIADSAKLNGATLVPPHAPFGFRAQPLLGVVPVENKYPYGSGSVSLFSLFWYVPVIEKPIIRSSEVYLALAEAALFNLRAGDANALFRKGIEEGITEVLALYNNGKNQLPDILKLLHGNSFDVNSFLTYKSIKQSEIDAFFASPVTTLSGALEEKLEQIINQKMIALYPNELEGWSEWRRTGYPRVLVASNEQGVLKGVAPRRKHYPQSERLINSANFNEAVSRIGGKDDLLSKVWWDANTAAPHKHSGTIEWRATPWK